MYLRIVYSVSATDPACVLCGKNAVLILLPVANSILRIIFALLEYVTFSYFPAPLELPSPYTRGG